MTASSTASMPSAGKAVIQGLNLDCRRGGRLLFEGLNLYAGSGELLQIAGPNGCGKTSLLRILCGLRAPDSGTVNWRGRDIAEAAEDFRAELSFVAFQPGLKLELSPRENLRYAVSIGAGDVQDEDEVLLALGLDAWADTPCRQLSAGQVRRAALSRLLMQRRHLWILDEPFTGLDQLARTAVESLVFRHANHGGTVIFTTHHPLAGHHAGLRLLELGA